MAVITKDRPDPRFYINIVQYDDGNWAADPWPLDDVTNDLFGIIGIVTPGLRTVTIGNINDYTLKYISDYAPQWRQNNALYVLQNPGNYDSATVQAAQALWDWINAVRAVNNSETAKIVNMDFNQLVAYTIVGDPWPPPPAGLTSVPAAPNLSRQSYA